jgi:chaperone modulatory protein CbpM
MTKDDRNNVISGEIIESATEITVTELCRVCGVTVERIVHLVDEGVVEPLGREPSRWRFSSVCVRRVLYAERLARDLEVNTAGAALAIELLEEIERLRQRLDRIERHRRG